MQTRMLSLALIAGAAVGLLAPREASAAFADCESARNQGLNSGEFLVKGTMKQVGCDPQLSEKAEASLVSAARRLAGFESSDDDATKACLASGVYTSFASSLASEYAKCSAQGASAGPLGVEKLATLAVAVAEGLSQAVAGRVTPELIQAAFRLPAELSVSAEKKEADSQRQCQAAVASALEIRVARRAQESLSSAAVLSEPLAKELAAVVCGLGPKAAAQPSPQR